MRTIPCLAYSLDCTERLFVVMRWALLPTLLLPEPVLTTVVPIRIGEVKAAGEGPAQELLAANVTKPGLSDSLL